MIAVIFEVEPRAGERGTIGAAAIARYETGTAERSKAELAALGPSQPAGNPFSTAAAWSPVCLNWASAVSSSLLACAMASSVR
jgi:hypothetical protein